MSNLPTETAASLDRQLTQVMDERDRAEAYADQLADCIEAITGSENGEHSSGNMPWENAIEAAQEYLVKKQPHEPREQFPLLVQAINGNSVTVNVMDLNRWSLAMSGQYARLDVCPAPTKACCLCEGHSSELSTSEWKPHPQCPQHGAGT